MVPRETSQFCFPLSPYVSQDEHQDSFGKTKLTFPRDHTLSVYYTVKLPDKVCVSHMKPVGENKTVLQLKQFAEVLLTGLTFKKIFKKL